MAVPGAKPSLAAVSCRSSLGEESQSLGRKKSSFGNRRRGNRDLGRPFGYRRRHDPGALAGQLGDPAATGGCHEQLFHAPHLPSRQLPKLAQGNAGSQAGDSAGDPGSVHSPRGGDPRQSPARLSVTSGPWGAVASEHLPGGAGQNRGRPRPRVGEARCCGRQDEVPRCRETRQPLCY